MATRLSSRRFQNLLHHRPPHHLRRRNRADQSSAIGVPPLSIGGDEIRPGPTLRRARCRQPIADVELSTDGDFEHRILNIYEGIVFLCVIMWVFGIIPLPMVLVSAVVGAGAMGVYLTNRYSGLPEVMDKRIIRAEVRDLVVRWIPVPPNYGPSKLT